MMLEQWTVNLDRNDPSEMPMNVRLYVKTGEGKLPVILFSHDAALHPDNYERILIPWATAGYMVIAPTHLDHNLQDFDQKKMWLSRLDDCMRALCFLGDAARADLSKIAIAGHGSGAVVAQALAGAVTYDIDGEIVQAKDPRVHALISLCPRAVQNGLTDSNSWDDIILPMITQTESGVENWKDALVAHHNARSNFKDLIILNDIEQSFKVDTTDPHAIDKTNFEALANLNRYVINFLNKHLAP